MRIYSMTATFGKLEHQTLTLKPGLNVIHAPNEWGKSTWCAFLLAMLYGLDTRSKTTRTGLPEKERYAPWSGSPMSGRMELSWNGRDITIERTTKGRVPMGAFRAYETHSGMEVPELNESNCGQLLLGVERSVFQRAGFVRQAVILCCLGHPFLIRLGPGIGQSDRVIEQFLLPGGILFQPPGVHFLPGLKLCQLRQGRLQVGALLLGLGQQAGTVVAAAVFQLPQTLFQPGSVAAFVPGGDQGV